MSEEILDVADKAAESEGKGGAGKAARIMARAFWLVEWTAANPDATQEDRKAAWKAASEERTGKVKLARKALKIMGKRGVTFIVAPGADADETVDDDV